MRCYRVKSVRFVPELLLVNYYIHIYTFNEKIAGLSLIAVFDRPSHWFISHEVLTGLAPINVTQLRFLLWAVSQEEDMN